VKLPLIIVDCTARSSSADGFTANLPASQFPHWHRSGNWTPFTHELKIAKTLEPLKKERVRRETSRVATVTFKIKPQTPNKPV
jgi:hypothetical protein